MTSNSNSAGTTTLGAHTNFFDSQRDEFDLDREPKDSTKPTHDDEAPDDDRDFPTIDEMLDGDLTPWPRSWLGRVHPRVLMYHPEYSHMKGARKYRDFSDDELLCSMCVELQLDFEAAMKMGPYELARVVYDRFRRLRVPEQTEEGLLFRIREWVEEANSTWKSGVDL